MKHWKLTIGALVIAVTAVLPAHADLFTANVRPAVQDLDADIFRFRIGEEPRIGRDARTFSSIAGAAAVRPLLPAGEAGGEAGAGARRPTARPAILLESTLWLTIGVGVMLIGVVKLRLADGPG